jgi:hypothetical protein
MSHVPDSPVCHNCGAALGGRFCAVCGQKAQPLNQTLHDFLHDFTHEMLHVDGRIFRSVRKLLFSPGFLTVEYFEGRRARWISPIRLYLIFSVIYFAVASLPGGGARVLINASDPEDVDELNRLGFRSEQELQETVRHAQATWTPRVMFVLVPLSAWLVQVACRRTGRNYPQHLYFALHVHAALFAAGAVAAAARLAKPRAFQYGVVALATLYALAYVVLAFRRAYGGSIRRAIMRAAVVGIAYWAVIILAVIAIVLPVLLWRR